MAVEVIARNGTETGHVQNLFSGLITNLDRNMTYGISADGQKVLVVVDEGARSSFPLDTARELASGSKAVRSTIRPVVEGYIDCFRMVRSSTGNRELFIVVLV